MSSALVNYLQPFVSSAAFSSSDSVFFSVDARPEAGIPAFSDQRPSGLLYNNFARCFFKKSCQITAIAFLSASAYFQYHFIHKNFPDALSELIALVGTAVSSTVLFSLALKSYLVGKKIVPIFNWSSKIIHVVQESNQHKTCEAPIALILHTVSDYNGAFSSKWTECDFFPALKNHLIVLKRTFSGNIQCEIEKIANLFQKKISILLLYGHGSSDSIIMSSFPDYRLRSSDVNESMFREMTTDGKIIVISCLTGQRLCPVIAQTSQRHTYGPINESNSLQEIVVDCPLHSVEMVSSREIFNSGASCPIKNDLYRKEMIRRLGIQENDSEIFRVFVSLPVQMQDYLLSFDGDWFYESFKDRFEKVKDYSVEQFIVMNQHSDFARQLIKRGIDLSKYQPATLSLILQNSRYVLSYLNCGYTLDQSIGWLCRPSPPANTAKYSYLSILFNPVLSLLKRINA